jgi:hypothetical protein
MPGDFGNSIGKRQLRRGSKHLSLAQLIHLAERNRHTVILIEAPT